MYNIQRSDDINGSSYSIIIPKDELDQNALYTIMYEKPDFLVPVSYRVLNDSIELSYNVGNLILMKYLSRERKAEELPFMWRNIILPLNECRDYFMNPLSLVLNMEYMFCDNRNSNKIKYIYIPTKNALCHVEDLKRMIQEVLEDNPFSDAKIENSILRGLQNFSLDGFVSVIHSWELSEMQEKTFPEKEREILKSYREEPLANLNQESSVAFDSEERRENPWSDEGGQEESGAFVKEKKLSFGMKKDKKAPKKKEEKAKSSLSLDLDDMFGEEINLQLGKKAKVKEKEEKVKKEKKSLGLFGKKEDKKKEEKEKKGLFGRKKTAVLPQDLSEPEPEPIPKFSVPDNYVLNLKNRNSSTELLELSSARLIYKGVKNHPDQIEVDIENGETFMIGRVDTRDTYSKKDFEFPIETKAVSRKHAVIIKKDEFYYIDDLNSKAGTYVDGKRVMPNHPFRLYSGCQISFGTLGADYIWEENHDGT